MSSEERPDLGKRLIELRREKGLTLSDLARLTGLSRSTLYKVEHSGMWLTYQKLLRLSGGWALKSRNCFA
ncbi:MAG: helix-turn-helix domain-containing protein [Steroidobacteraceae bacterium]